GKQGIRNVKRRIEALRSPQVYDRVQFAWVDYVHRWQLGRLEVVPENASHVFARKLIGLHNARAVAHQTALLGELAPLVDRRNPKLFRLLEHFLALAVEERVGGDEQCGDAAELLEGGMEISGVAGFRGRVGKRQPHRVRRKDQSTPLIVELGTVRID